MKEKCFSALETFKEGAHVEKALFQIFIGVLKGIERHKCQKNTKPMCKKTPRLVVWCVGGGMFKIFVGPRFELNLFPPSSRQPPSSGPPPAGGRQGSHESLRIPNVHISGPGSSKTPPKFNKKTHKKERNLGGRAEWGLGGRSHPRLTNFSLLPGVPFFLFLFFSLASSPFLLPLPLSPSPTSPGPAGGGGGVRRRVRQSAVQQREVLRMSR